MVPKCRKSVECQLWKSRFVPWSLLALSSVLLVLSSVVVAYSLASYAVPTAGRMSVAVVLLL